MTRTRRRPECTDRYESPEQGITQRSRRAALTLPHAQPAVVEVPKKNRSGLKTKEGDGQGGDGQETSVRAGGENAEASLKAGTVADASVKAGAKAEASVKAGAKAETSVRAGAKAETSVKAGATAVATPAKQSLPVKGASTKR